MGRCEPRTNENDPGLITLPEGIDELGDAVKSEFDVTTKQVCRALQCTRPFVLSHCKHIRHIYVSGDWSDKVGLGPGGGFIWSRKELRDLAVNGTVERRTRVVGAADILAGSREAMDWLEAAAAEAAELGSDPRRSRADEVKFRELSREVFERVCLPDEWKPAYNAARLKRSQMHWVDLGEHPRSFDELGTVWRTTADRKGYGDTDEEWSRAYRRNGAVRLTITLPDGATKVMYAPDQTPRAWFDDFLATILPVELLPQDYIRDVVLGDDHMEPHELKLYG